MDIIKILNEFDKIGWGSSITAIILIIILIPSIIDSWNKLLDSIGLQTKASAKRKEQEHLFEDIKNALEKSQIEIYNKQQEYHEQSIEIRNKLKDDQKKLEENQEKINEDIKTLINSFENYIKMDNKRTIATLRSSLWQIHGNFVKQGYITPEGLKTFMEMGKVYTAAGGDDIYHDKLEPEVLALPIKSGTEI